MRVSGHHWLRILSFHREVLVSSRSKESFEGRVLKMSWRETTERTEGEVREEREKKERRRNKRNREEHESRRPCSSAREWKRMKPCLLFLQTHFLSLSLTSNRKAFNDYNQEVLQEKSISFPGYSQNWRQSLSLTHKSIVQVILHTWSWCCCCSPRGTRVVKSTLFLSFSSSRVRSLLSSLEPEDHHRVNQRRKKFLEHHPLPLLLSSLIPSSLFSPQSVLSVFRRPLFSCSHLSSRRRILLEDPSSLFRLKKRGKKFFRQKEHTRRHSIQEDKWKLYHLQEERESPSDMNIGSSATSSAASAAYGTYYDPFYPNSGHSWSAYAAPPPGSNSSLSASGPCGLLSSAGHKGLSGAHFTPVHQQRRKRRVLFTQAQVSRFKCYSSDPKTLFPVKVSFKRTATLCIPSSKVHSQWYSRIISSYTHLFLSISPLHLNDFVHSYFLSLGLWIGETIQTTEISVCPWKRASGPTHSFDSDSGKKRIRKEKEGDFTW